jgi:rhodanese-related sulfurtransferase
MGVTGTYIPPMARRLLALCFALSTAVMPVAGCDSPAGDTAGGPASGNTRSIDGAEARRLVAEEGAFLLDVRSTEEFGSGHVEGATNIPIQELDSRLAEVPEDKPVVVYCLSGGRSAMAARELTAAGRDVYDLGPMSAW